MKLPKEKIKYGRHFIEFEVKFVARQTLEIAVHPGGAVAVRAPLRASLASIKEKVQKRARWIRRQKDFFRQFEPRTTARKYVGGESHLYLGKHYRLRLKKGQPEQVKMHAGRLLVTHQGEAYPEKIKHLLENWYLQKAVWRFSQALNQSWSGFKLLGYERPRINIQTMQRRWASLSVNGRLTINLALIRAPQECIDYVVTHELCHLKFKDHDKRFWQLLDKVMPDWKKRKGKLEKLLA